MAAGLVGCSFPHQTHVVGVGVLVAAFFLMCIGGVFKKESLEVLNFKAFAILFAVRRGLEPLTPCVTG
ncbi:hypothetical protein, partial [uncultured Alistipes sp.]|uniref:hypothetical protein n=1 Tax=uncultured Alistipes sp. TaxID=538949 RepID=UPI0026593485